VPAVTEALSKGVIDGTTIPWEVTPALKVSELVKNHTTFAGAQGLYTQTFAFSMNRASYDKLPPDLKAVIDKNSGIETAAMFGRAMDDGDKAGWRLPSARATTSWRWTWPRRSAGAAPPPRWKPTGSTKSRPRASTAPSWLPRPVR